jgi:hypothetical protein
MAAESSGQIAADFLATRGAHFDEQIIAASNAAAVAVLENAGSLIDAGCLAAVAVRDVKGASVSSTRQAAIASQIVIEHGGRVDEAAETAARVVRDDFFFSMRSFEATTLSFRDWVNVAGKAAQAAGSAVLSFEARAAAAAAASAPESKSLQKKPAESVAKEDWKLSEKGISCMSTALSSTVDALQLWTNPLSDSPKTQLPFTTEAMAIATDPQNAGTVCCCAILGAVSATEVMRYDDDLGDYGSGGTASSATTALLGNKGDDEQDQAAGQTLCAVALSTALLCCGAGAATSQVCSSPPSWPSCFTTHFTNFPNQTPCSTNAPCSNCRQRKYRYTHTLE